MEKRIWLGLCLLPMAISVGRAQSTRPMWATIPFEFRLGTSTMPAGEYDIVPGPGTNSVLLRCREKQASAFVLSQPVQARTEADTGKLIFHRYGDTHFLAQIWHPGENRGYQLPKSKAEREMARNPGGVTLASVTASTR